MEVKRKKKKGACYILLTVRFPTVSRETGDTSPHFYMPRPGAPHARDHFITFHVLLTLANVCFTSILYPRKHPQHSSSVYLRDTGYTAGRVGSGPTAWRVNWIHGGPKGSPPKSRTGARGRASQKFGSVDRKFRASPARSRPPVLARALLNTRFNGSAFMHVRRGGI